MCLINVNAKAQRKEEGTQRRREETDTQSRQEEETKKKIISVCPALKVLQDFNDDSLYARQKL
jgi:hypothetical protein